MDVIHPVFQMFRAVYRGSNIKTSRYFSGFFVDRLSVALVEPDLKATLERLLALMDCPPQPWLIKDYLAAADSPDGPRLHAWLREFPRLAGMICALKDEEMGDALNAIELPDTSVNDVGQAYPPPAYDLPITLRLESPLAHGSDQKSGNVTTFRRRSVLATNGTALYLPFYAGNAFRGQLRDILADHLFKSLEIDGETNTAALWFFHAAYAGGVLEEKSKDTKAVVKELGDNGAIKSQSIALFRRTLPSLSLLGTALGNRIIAGRLQVCDFRPDSLEWGGSKTPVAQLMGFEFLTRREDSEEKEDTTSAMIATTETISTGATLRGGINLDAYATELERSALAYALTKVKHIGAEARRGFGLVKLESENAADPQLYLDYVGSNKAEIMRYLIMIGALA